MTTRITLAILLITLTLIVVGDSAAYFTAREALLALMDDSMAARGSSLLEQGLHAIPTDEASLPPGDSYSIQDDEGRLLRHSQATTAPRYSAVVIRKGFEVRQGKRYRTVVIGALPLGEREETAPPLSLTYSRPMTRLDDLLNYLLAVLSSVGVFCGLATAWVALKVSRAALRPLRDTAEVISRIDEKQLSRRIDERRLPVELVPMTRRLNEMLERLETVFLLRKQFLADAAHELRTPTAALMTTLEVALRRQRDAGALVEALQSALGDARLLRRLVERLLEHARADHLSGGQVEVVDVAGLIRETVKTLGSTAAEKQVEMQVEAPDVLAFVTERQRLQSILLNLVGNAIEYNRVGGTVRIRAASKTGRLELSVHDSGEGIGAEHLPHVFEPFYRADRGPQPGCDHLGLGLFLVQTHVRALGGDCRLESVPGDGTQVSIILPAKDVA